MASTYEKIATTTLGSATGTVTFSSIPATYTDLFLVIGGAASSSQGLYLYFNNDTASNYSRTYVYGDGSSAGSANSTTDMRILEIGSAISTVYANIMNYSNTTTFKTSLSRGGSASSLTIAQVGLWRSTSAINRVDIVTGTGTINTGTVLTIYGIKAA